MKQDTELQEAFERNLDELASRLHRAALARFWAAVGRSEASWTHVGSLASINQALQDVESHIRALQALGE